MKLHNIIKNSKGFTMIELVIVIAVLGILAALAIPKFSNISVDARRSSANGLAASINSALGIIKAKYIAQGSTGNTVTLNGNIQIPVDTNGQIIVAATNDCANLSQNLTSLNPNERDKQNIPKFMISYNLNTKTCYMLDRANNWSVAFDKDKAYVEEAYFT